MRIKWDLTKMAEDAKCRPSGTIAFTLPISCQICLGKVKAPVVCPNQHVFCEPCLDVWLQRNPHCPACRAPINNENPFKKVLGGLNQGDESMCESFSNPELRRARLELLVRDYEDEVERLQGHLVNVEAENKMLKERVQRMSPGSDSGSDKESSKNERSSPDVNVLLVMTKKLQDANSLYEKAKKDASRLKEKNRQLTDENINLVRENQRLRIEVANRSPMKFGRYTVAAMQSKIDNYEKEVKQLQKALEKSDSYIEEIERELEAFKRDGDPSIFNALQAKLQSDNLKEDNRSETCRKSLFGNNTKTRKDADNEVKAEKGNGGVTDSKASRKLQLGSGWRVDHPDGQPQGKSTPQCSKTNFEESQRSSTFITGRTGGRTSAKLKADGSFDLELPSPITPTVPLSRLNIKDKKESSGSEERAQVLIDGKEFELPLPEATRNLDDENDEDSSELPPALPGIAENDKGYERSASRSSSGSSGPPTPTRRFPVMGISASYSIGHSPSAREGSAPGVGYSLYSGDEMSPGEPKASGSGEGPSSYNPGLYVFTASGEARRRSNGSTGLNSYNATAVLSLKSGPLPVPDSTTDLEPKPVKNESFDSSITPEFSDCLKILNEAEEKVGRRKQEGQDQVDAALDSHNKFLGVKTEDSEHCCQTQSDSHSSFDRRSSTGSQDSAARIIYGKKCNPHLKSMCDMDGNRRFSFGGKLGEMRQNLKHFLRRTPEKRKRSESGNNGEDPVPCSPAKKVHH